MVGKKFGEDAERVARKFVERMAPHQEQGAEELEELARIRELAGLKTESGSYDDNEDDDDDLNDPDNPKNWGGDINDRMAWDDDRENRREDRKSIKNEDEDELEELRDELRYLYKSIYDSASQGNDETDHIVDELGDLFDRVEEIGDPDMQKGYEMLRSTVDTSPEEQAEAAQRALVSLARSEPDIEIDREDIEGERIGTESNVSEDSEGVFHVDTKKEDMIDVKVVDYHYDSYAEDIIIELENAETGEPVEITDITSGRADIENWVQNRMQKEKDDRDYSEDSSDELNRIRKLSGIAQGIGY